LSFSGFQTNLGCAINSLFFGVISFGMVRVITQYPLALNRAALVTLMARGPSTHPPSPPRSPIFVSWQQGSTASLASAFTAVSIMVSVSRPEMMLKFVGGWYELKKFRGSAIHI